MKCDSKQLLLFAAANLLVTALSREIGFSHAMGADIDYACGLYLAVLVCSGRACWWRWTAAAFAAEIAAEALFQGDLQPTALLHALAHVVGVLAAAWLIRRTRGFPYHFDTMSDVLALLAFAAVPGAVVTAGAELAIQAWHGRQVTGIAWVLAWEGHVLGMILVAPAVLVARQSRGEWPRMNALLWAEAVIAFMVIVLAVTRVFNSPLPLVYLVLPPVLWVGLRFGMSVMALALLLISAMVLHYTGAGTGPFAAAARTPVEGPLLAQSFLVVGSASALLLAALAGQWRRTQDILRRSHGALEALVSTRTTALQDSEQSLRDNEARFRIARDAARMIVVDWDIPRDEMTFSDSPEWLRGPLPASGKYPLFKDQVHADDRTYFLETRQRGIDTLEGQTVQFRVVRTDGVVLHILSYQTMFAGPDGKAVRMVAVHQDISERRQIEVALAENQRQLAASEARYRTLFENNPLMYFTLDGSGFVVSVNPQGATQLGYRVDELVGRPVTAVFPAAVHHQVLAQLRRCMNEPDRAHTWEITKLRKDGAAMHVRESAVAVRDEDGAPLLLVMCENVTEHKQAEMALRESEQRLRTLLDAIPDRVRLRDVEGRYVMVNRAARESMGMPTSQFIGKSVFDVRPSAVAALIDAEARMAIATGAPIRRERKSILDGTWREVIIAPLRNSTGEIVGVVDISRDITERKQSALDALRDANDNLRRLTERQEALLESERTRIAQNLHDGVGQSLNLAHIKLDEAATGATPMAAALQAVTQIIEQSAVAIRTLEFELSPPVLRELGLAPALEWLGEEMQRQYGLQVNVSNDGDAYPLGDLAGAIAFRATRELLINVIKHAGVDRAHVDLQRVGQQVIITVSDEGAGFDGQSAAVGLGLVSVRDRLRFIGGNAAIDGADGGGTVATLTLPLLAEAGADGSR